MSEENSIKAYKLKKAVPGNVILVIHPFSNLQLSKTVTLTDRNPTQVLPEDWALGIFVDDDNYGLYKKGIFTFENNNELVKRAYEVGAYFDEVLDFTPAKDSYEKEVLAVLKSGNRANIDKAISTHGQDAIKQVATAHVDELSTGVVRLLESILRVQLVLDGGEVLE